jgi:hypothetical protein
MTNYIGREFTHHGLKGAKQPATVIGQSEPKGRAGKVLVTVQLADGTEYKTDARSIPSEVVFAPPATGPMFTGRDLYRYDRNGRIFCAEG